MKFKHIEHLVILKMLCEYLTVVLCKHYIVHIVYNSVCLIYTREANIILSVYMSLLADNEYKDFMSHS